MLGDIDESGIFNCGKMFFFGFFDKLSILEVLGVDLVRLNILRNLMERICYEIKRVDKVKDSKSGGVRF